MRAVVVGTLLLLHGCSCSEDGSLISPSRLIRMARKVDPSVQRVPIPQDEKKRRILCRDYEEYGSGCVPGFGMRLQVGLVELVVVRFDSVSAAMTVAEKIGEWHAGNWVLDNVSGEPTLEVFVKKAFNAKPGNPGQR